MSTFTAKNNRFFIDDTPVQIVSGAIHYFRVVPEYWRDRLEKLKAMGCNTVETYIAWNVHEPKKGQFCFDGMADVVSFVRLAQELGLYVILRPAPYICAEWEFGGLPAWLLAEDGMRVRVCYEPFLKHVQEYYDVLLPLIAPLQITKGGPVIMVQVENEYGSYSNDAQYMQASVDMLRRGGIDVLLVTSDGGRAECFAGGAIKGVLPTVNGGSHSDDRFDVLRQFNEDGPLMCMEFWIGWFDAWGNDCHMTGNLESSVQNLDILMQRGNLSFYMFHGGTNFGFMNGSNYYDKLTPDVTSYDYGSPLSEDGQITEKYMRYREVIGKYRTLPPMEFTTPIEQKAYGTFPVRRSVSLWDVIDQISTPIESSYTQSMECLGQSYGYTLYRTALRTEQKLTSFRLWGANDRALVYVDGEKIATLYDRELLEECQVNVPHCQGAVMDILMENMGRVNYGPMMERQRKGIDQGVQINFHLHSGWTQYCLPLDNLECLDFEKSSHKEVVAGQPGCHDGAPAFYEIVFDVEKPADTFLDLDGWGKGCVFLNGFNLGRFWEIGPQKRLYIPAPLLRAGENKIIVFETEGKASEEISLLDEPDLGAPERQ